MLQAYRKDNILGRSFGGTGECLDKRSIMIYNKAECKSMSSGREGASAALCMTKKRMIALLLLLAALLLAACPVMAEEEQEDGQTADSLPQETEQPGPDMRFTREFSTRYAEYGDRVTLNYTVCNDGILPLESIRVEDRLVGEVGRIDRLEGGERKTLSVRVKVTESCVSEPVVHYECGGQTYTEERGAESISLAQVSLHAELAADKTNVAPGEMVTLRLRLVNQSNVNLYSLCGDEPILGEMGNLVGKLAPGEEYTVTRTVQMKSSGTFQFSVTGSSDTGGAVSVQSNEMSVLVTPVAAEIQLTLHAEADKTELNGPGEVTFSLQVSNDCSLELRDVVLSEETKGEIRRLAFVPTGEMPAITQTYDVQESRTYLFRAQVIDSVGDELTVYSNPVGITVLDKEETEPTEEPEAQQTVQPERTNIPVLDGTSYRLEEDMATFERLMAGTVAVVAVVLFLWYITAKFRKWSARRKKARLRRKQKKNKQANRKK